MRTKEELKRIYENVNNQDREHFLEQLRYFRKFMCSNKFSSERKELEFGNLAQAYLRCKLEQRDITLFTAISDEFARRRIYEELKPLVTNGGKLNWRKEK